MKIHLISAALPPKLDGIGDYTGNLATALAASHQVTVLTRRGNAPDPIPGVRIEPCFSPDDRHSVWNLLTHLDADPPDWVVLQYNSFSYGRWGLNLHLPEVMRAIRRRHPNTKFALMAHEPFVPVLDVKHAVMTTWQRWQLWRLGRSADIVFFSLEPWTDKFRSWFPGRPVQTLQVGSNIPQVPMSADERAALRAELGLDAGTIALGFFGSAHNSRLLDWVRGATEAVLRAGYQAQLLYVGPNTAEMGRVMDGLPMRSPGALPPAEVSRHLAAMDIFLSPFVDGISTRRGSLLAGLQHGLATVGTHGYNTGRSLLAQNGKTFLLTDIQSQDEFNAHVVRLAGDPAARQQLGDEASRFFEQGHAWNTIAADLTAALATVQGNTLESKTQP